MRKQGIVASVVGLSLVAMLTAACSTLGGGAIGTGSGAAIGAGVGAAAGTVYGWSH